jgi:hypothetical protein
MLNTLIRFDTKQANKTCFIRFEANKYSLHIRLYSLRTDHRGAPYAVGLMPTFNERLCARVGPLAYIAAGLAGLRPGFWSKGGGGFPYNVVQ